MISSYLTISALILWVQPILGKTPVGLAQSGTDFKFSDVLSNGSKADSNITFIETKPEWKNCGSVEHVQNVMKELHSKVSDHFNLQSVRHAYHKLTTNQITSGRRHKRMFPPMGVAKDSLVNFPITFVTSSSYLTVDLKLDSSYNIFFLIKTSQSNSLLLYSNLPFHQSARGICFVGVELLRGRIKYSYGSSSLDGGGCQSTPTSNDTAHYAMYSSVQVDDDKWHGVSITCLSSHRHVLRVDETVTYEHAHLESMGVDSQKVINSDITDSSPNQKLHRPSDTSGRQDGKTKPTNSDNSDITQIHKLQRPFEITERQERKVLLNNHVVYLGGLPEQEYSRLPAAIWSVEGYEGCMASVDIDGNSVTLNDPKVKVKESLRLGVRRGCKDTRLQHGECTARSCDNGGVCLQLLNSFTCDCTFTSFTGHTCSDDSIAYTFGPMGGLITYSARPMESEDTIADNLTMGLITMKSNSVVLSISSETSGDYLQLRLIDGYVHAEYNLGLSVHRISEALRRVDDGVYHVISFSRHGSNSTLRVDDLPAQTRTPTGMPMTIFDGPGTVDIGGRKGPLGNPVETFTGTIAGFVLNDDWLLEMAAEGDDRLTVYGDIQLEIKPLRPHLMKSTPEIDLAGEETVSENQRHKNPTQNKMSVGDGDDDFISLVALPSSECLEVECPEGSGVEVDSFIHAVVGSKDRLEVELAKGEITDDEDFVSSGVNTFSSITSRPKTTTTTSRHYVTTNQSPASRQTFKYFPSISLPDTTRRSILTTENLKIVSENNFGRKQSFHSTFSTDHLDVGKSQSTSAARAVDPFDRTTNYQLTTRLPNIFDKGNDNQAESKFERKPGSSSATDPSGKNSVEEKSNTTMNPSLLSAKPKDNYRVLQIEESQTQSMPNSPRQAYATRINSLTTNIVLTACIIGGTMALLIVTLIAVVRLRKNSRDETNLKSARGNAPSGVYKYPYAACDTLPSATPLIAACSGSSPLIGRDSGQYPTNQRTRFVLPTNHKSEVNEWYV